ncbi:hypothetical protein [Chryseobacterium angstadtii]|uniref:hypothetical protein n=1 Tax=Chryseobacterium angstadtii TaxID=558151 RepID=UPI001039020A|nr:hypothetical protein [Chryseobacterium angstadtii]
MEYALIGTVVFCFLYFILWRIFKEKMPLHEHLDHIYKNYDSYAERVIILLPLALVVVTALLLMRPTPAKRFLRLQNSIPTSKIKSLAKGLVEIEGTLIMKDQMISPVNHEICIGYYYTIEDIEKDDNNRESYTTTHRETRCKVFQMKDDTGMIEVQPEGIELIFLEKTNISSNGNKRYTETLLKDGQKMLLVGYADGKDGVPFIRKDEHYKVLGITSASGINVWNTYQPLLRSFLFTCSIILLIIIYLLLQ